MRVEDIHQGRAVRGVSFAVHAGEILGIAGLVGSGRTETVRAIFGADRLDAGSIYLYGRKLQIRSPRDAVKAGIALIPEDRKAHGVVLSLPMAQNITLPSLKAFTNWVGMVALGKERSSLISKSKT